MMDIGNKVSDVQKRHLIKSIGMIFWDHNSQDSGNIFENMI